VRRATAWAKAWRATRPWCKDLQQPSARECCYQRHDGDGDISPSNKAGPSGRDPAMELKPRLPLVESPEDTLSPHQERSDSKKRRTDELE
jgi:hypothetical protein